MKMGKNDIIAHNVRFYNPKPRAIHCLALESKNKKLALSRSDNSIEIWDVKFLPQLEKSICNEPSDTVEDIRWLGNRLFSCGLQGYIVEYDCFTESHLHSVSVIGGSAWCLDICSKNNLMACGTENGYVNIMEITQDSFEFFKFLDKQQGRILCICWEKSGQYLVTGSADVIRVWNVEKGHAVHKMMTGRSQTHKETIVWSLRVTSDFIIISGDSRGFLCFWDGKLGTQIENFNSHEADIFSVILNEDETEVYCAGVDPLITIYGKVLEITGSRRKWAKGGNRRIHDLDVRALALSSDGKLYSGGVDGYLVVSSFAPKVLLKFPPLIKGPFFKVLPFKRYLMLRYLSHLEIWKLGRAVSQGKCDSFLKLSESERIVLRLNAKPGETIIASSISKNGQFLAYSTNLSIRFFKLSVEQSTLIKLPNSTGCGPCRIIEFYETNKRQFCVVATKKNEINIMEVGESGPDIVHTIRPKENELLKDTISHLAVASYDESFLIAADCSGSIIVWSMSNWFYHCSLPKYKATITALSVNDKMNYIIVAYSDFKIVLFDIKLRKYTKFSRRLRNHLADYLHTPIVNIALDPRRDSAIIVHDDSFICILNDDEVLCTNDSKIAKLSENFIKEGEIERKPYFTIIKKPKHLVGVDWLENDELITITICPLKFAEHYPPAFQRKMFIK